MTNLLGQASGTSEKLAGEAVTSMLRGSLKASATINNRLTVDRPTFSLGGLHLMVQLGGRSRPRHTTKSSPPTTTTTTTSPPSRPPATTTGTTPTQPQAPIAGS